MVGKATVFALAQGLAVCVEVVPAKEKPAACVPAERALPAPAVGAK
jgi:hypothetical protein